MTTKRRRPPFFTLTQALALTIAAICGLVVAALLASTHQPWQSVALGAAAAAVAGLRFAVDMIGSEEG